ncbi:MULTISPECIES: 3D domain-containing protein [unclassified Paenibacillus]|uniref:3D domain-containing protein n=1 Tax=unclassified Paenibacillus TaxID=185978 RepID=UPI000838EE74|nr:MULTISPECIES: 3D domain-containing protein [unclassified Paenibacillus]NWL90138.1 LysM peptidoglycan-binding domain-containing protein [Paenibacillus sp. 79R4]
MKKQHTWTFKRMMKTALITAGLFGAIQSVPALADSLHTAKEGDTFYTLSKQYGVPMDKLMTANPTIQATNIYEGLSITIPDNKSNTMSAPEMKASSADSAILLPTLSVLADQKVVEAWGKSFNYSKTISAKATAYSSAPSENGGYGAVDYYGNPLKLGTIAVDPKVIPLGTKVLVTGHDHEGLPKKAFVATATDIGGAIKGNRIDIFIPGSTSFVNQFGYQDVKLFVLK